MKVGRNDPCPCGSGRKYKHCCLAADRAAKRAAAAETFGGGGGVLLGAEGLSRKERERVLATDVWELDVVPLPILLDDDPAARPAARLVSALGFVLETETLRRPSPEVDDLARTLEEGVRRAAATLGVLPPRLRVREEVVAEALAARLDGDGAGGDGVPAVEAGVLEHLDDIVSLLNETYTGRKSRAQFSQPRTWAGWALPGELVGRLFRAAAALYRAAPWQVLAEVDPLVADGPQGTRWLVQLRHAPHGEDPEEPGFLLIGDPDGELEDSPSASPDDLPRSETLAFSFVARGELDPEERREVRRRGWEVAGPRGYPRLVAVNMPAGGLRRRVAQDLVAFLEALPALAARLQEVGVGGMEAVWHHEATGCTVEPYLPFTAAGDLPLVPGDALGPGAEPEAVLAGLVAVEENVKAFVAAELAVLDRFARYLAEEVPLASSTVDRHADNAGDFVEYLAGSGVPVRAVHVCDLLEFLYDWYPRRVAHGATRRRAMPVSLGHFFSFLAAEEGIRCPWAEPVLADREQLERRWDECPEGPWWDSNVSEWRAVHWDAVAELRMLPDMGLGDSDEWGDSMGPVEFRLFRELERRWLLWRDDLLRSGVDDPMALEQELCERQRAWERAPHPDLTGDNPMTAVWRERRDREKGRKRYGRWTGP